jgi:hypothetical protein
MKKSVAVFSSFILLLLFSLFFTTKVSAKVLTVEKGTVTVAKDETINDDLFIGAQDVEIEGTVNGNVYAGAQTVRIDGTINGSVHTGASAVYLSGTVSGNVYTGAGNVTLSGAKIGNSLHVGAGNIFIDKDSSIGGSLMAGGGTIAIYGPVKRNVMVAGGTVNLNSVVGGEVRIGAGNITIGPDTKIGKDLYYSTDQSQNNINISESASVSGSIKKVENNLPTGRNVETARRDLSGGFRAFAILVKIASLIGAFIIGLLWLRLFPKSFIKSTDLVANSFFKSLGIGFLVTIFAFPILLILAVTVVGLPLAGILLLILLLSFYLSKLVISLCLGTWIVNKFGWKKLSQVWVFILGLILIYLLKQIHVIGFLTSIVVLFSGVGALVLYYKSLITTK